MSGRWVWADPGLPGSWFVFLRRTSLSMGWGPRPRPSKESFLSICRFAPSRFLSEGRAPSVYSPLLFQGFLPPPSQERELFPEKTLPT